MQLKFDGKYAQLLDGKAHRALPGKEGVVYNDQHQPQAWRDVLLVYIPLLPVCPLPAPNRVGLTFVAWPRRTLQT